MNKAIYGVFYVLYHFYMSWERVGGIECEKCRSWSHRNGQKSEQVLQRRTEAKAAHSNGTPWGVCGMRENGPHSLSVVWHCPVCVCPALDPSQRIPYLTPIVHSGWLACWIDSSFSPFSRSCYRCVIYLFLVFLPIASHTGCWDQCPLCM